MRILKWSIVALAVVIGCSLTAIGWQKSIFLEKARNIEYALDMMRFNEAEGEIAAIKNCWFYRNILSNAYLRGHTGQDDYCRVGYYEGLARFYTGRYKDARASFIEASRSGNPELRRNALLSVSTALFLEGNINAQTVTEIVDYYKQIIKPSNDGSWAEKEAKERLFWILAKSAAGENASQMEEPGNGKERGKALNEAFKKSLNDETAPNNQ